MIDHHYLPAIKSVDLPSLPKEIPPRSFILTTWVKSMSA